MTDHTDPSETAGSAPNASSASASPDASPNASAAQAWTNWSGVAHCSPAQIAYPTTEAEIVRLVTEAPGPIRPVGTGHSFTEICVTTGTQISLRDYAAVLDIDPVTGTVRAQAGITIKDLGIALHARGLAMANLGDINVQQVAGALATATHGTGRAFGNISSQVVGARIVTGTGDVIELTEDDPDLRAVRVSVGALGIVTEFTLKVVPAFRIRKVESSVKLDRLIDELPERLAATDHLELYAFPYSGKALLLESTRTQAPAAPLPPWRQKLQHDFLENTVLGLIQRVVRRAPALAPYASRSIAALASGSDRTDHSHNVFASVRKVKFVEMEYALPAENVITALREVLAVIEERKIRTAFPIEVRWAAGDDAYLSTASGRDTGYVAVHQFVGMNYVDYFAAVEPIFTRLGGRPHWGKRHTRTANELAATYPHWEQFQQVRDRFDPQRRFTGEYLAQILGD